MCQRKCFFLVCLLVTAHLSAETIVVNPNPIVTANAISDNVTGSDLTGLVVVATFAEGTGTLVIPMTWTATGPISGSASGPGLAVSVTGDASGNLAWQYSSTILGPPISLEFDGTAAGVYFDRAHAGPGTPGSGPGADIVFGPLFPNGIDASIVVTYSSAVALAGMPPEDDLYAKLLIDFPNTVNGPINFVPQDFAFTQDVDHNIVPEPASWPLALAGLAALGVLLRCTSSPKDFEKKRGLKAARAGRSVFTKRPGV
ncbi:MAG TPA: PEP-CTERM sorting domain-containing protein [Bryobacteraceae bacterium]|nr:PEP-CTERM sorting domain-containing protein [Bryobacteraceae bacterium]